MTANTPHFDPRDEWDPLHSPSDPRTPWTSTNVSEAIPGVQTPLGWTLWERATNAGALEAGFRIGALDRQESRLPPDPYERDLRAFYGRAAFRAQLFATFGDRLPGSTGEEAVHSLFGAVPEGIDFEPTRRRYPVVAVRLPAAFWRTPRELREFANAQDGWWSQATARIERADAATTVALFQKARTRFDRALALQTVVVISVIQPLYEALGRLVEKLGAGDISRLTGPPGGAEMAVIADIWAASRDRIEVAEVARRHGFHGPVEGELSSRVWREDLEPLRRVVEQYAQRDDSHDPVRRDREHRRQHHETEAEVLASAPRLERPAVGLLLRLARERLPLRGVAKRSFLQAFDVTRACARRRGELLVADGLIDDAEDVFYLTADEFTRTLPGDIKDLVARRRARRAAYAELTIPTTWIGMPEPLAPSEAPPDAEPGDGRRAVKGLGVSAGVVEGTVRVVVDPAFAEVEPDEILVAPITDPSWSSVMFISSALIVDIGSLLSHAAVVARELDIPCVVDTRNGTKVLRTGDRVRVDGTAGTVEILERA
jgi:rifampicin phosphotransferase